MEEHSGFNVLKRSDIEERVKRRDSEYSGAVQRGCVKQKQKGRMESISRRRGEG